MKKLLLIILFLTGSCLLASAGPAPKDTGKKDTSKVAPDGKTNKSTVNSPGSPKGGSVTPKTVDTPSKATDKSCKTVDDSSIRPWIGDTLILIVLGVFIGTACYSSLLRDPVTNSATFMTAAHATSKYANEQDINKIPKPFSLARSQLAVWTVVIAVSYIYLELCKYSAAPIINIDKTLLALMGISAATTVGGNVIDNNATQAQQDVNGPSEGFFMDILSDQTGINIHRFQNVIWTLVAVTLFLCQVPDVACGSLPTLDSTLVALTGISSATYLGLKINENKN